MEKVLISWIAYHHDFTVDENKRVIINPRGTHSDFYNSLFDYTKHIVLSSFSEDHPDRKFSLLLKHLRDLKPKTVINPAYIGLEDVISVEEIKTKLFPLLNKYKDKEVEIFISPGTPAMQTAWYLLASEFENVKLFQVRPPHYREGKAPQKEFVKVFQTGIAGGHVIKEESRRRKDISSSPFIRKTNQALFEKAEIIAQAGKSTVLITGETGTGKGILAQYIHNQSLRSKHKMIPINCGAMGDELLESRLFGYKKGSHNQAYKDTSGAFEAAHNGTLFLDEIGDISKKMQQTLLKVLDDGEVYPIGGYKPIKVDVRVIAATNKDLLQLVRQGTFRSDLYYRLAISELETIPYRVFEDDEKIEFWDLLIDKLQKEYNKPFPNLNSSVKKILNSYWFPGNFREVKHLLESFIASSDTSVAVYDIPNRILNPEENGFSLNLEGIKDQHMEKVWRMFAGKINPAAKAMGVAGNTLRDRVTKLKWKL